MRRILILLAIAALALPAFAGRNRYGMHGLSVTIEDDDGPITDCSQIRVTYEDRSVPMVSENVNVGAPKTLRVRSDRNGGVYVYGGSGYSVTACKASALGDPRDINVSFSGGELTAERSDSSSSIVYFLIRAPRGASLDLGASNGAISVDSFDGTVLARAQNGPISVKDSAGSLDLSTVNGPISFAGDSGTVKLRAQNGPIAVKLRGGSWNGGGGLDAETQNGPLTLKLPRGYRSGVVVESDGHGPISCRAEACRDVRRFNDFGDDERPRRIELGSGTKVVTLSTNNGPIAVKEDGE